MHASMGDRECNTMQLSLGKKGNPQARQPWENMQPRNSKAKGRRTVHWSEYSEKAYAQQGGKPREGGLPSGKRIKKKHVTTHQLSQGKKGNPQARGTGRKQVSIQVCTMHGKAKRGRSCENGSKRGKARAGQRCTDKVQVSHRTRSQGQWAS